MAIGTSDFTHHPLGLVALAVFAVAYVLVVVEETIHLRKSKPVLLAAGIIWALIGIAYTQSRSQQAYDAAAHTIFEYGELFLFLLVAITYVNTLEDRRVFEALRTKLVSYQLNYRSLFWISGIGTFFISPLLDNLTTALLMGAVVTILGRDSPRFVAIACTNLVVAANAGGAFSPFGDITTLMVWQKGRAEFFDFFALFVPSLVNFVVPALFMHFAIPTSVPKSEDKKQIRMKPGAVSVMLLFAATIFTAVSFKNFFGLQPALGMMLGLGYLQVLAYILQLRGRNRSDGDMVLDSFAQIARVEWDTLLFFFGIVFSVSGLGILGYLGLASRYLYIDLGPTLANTAVGVLSAIVDNIPVMYAVLTIDPQMSLGQWLLVTLTTGVGGSLLSIGSAAGVALMGQAREVYTFSSHLKWSWAIALGYAASITVHCCMNSALFQI